MVWGPGPGEGLPAWSNLGELCARLLDAVPYTVYVYNLEEARIELSNRHLAADLGYQPAEIEALGDRVLGELMHPADRDRLPSLLGRWDQAADREVLEAEYRLRHASGGWRWMLGRDTVLERDEQGKVRRIVGTVLDITHRVELEQSLARAQTLEAVGRLAGGIAHDFNNLLTAIMANVALAQRAMKTGRPASTVLDSLDQIGRVADDAARLTRQLLTFARHPMGKTSRPEILDGNGVLLELRPMLRRLIEENVELTWRLSPDAPPVSIDRVSFTQVVLNLAVNARDAVLPVGRGTLSIATENLGGKLHLTVEDNGVGMPPEVAQRIFDPFFTTKPSAGASGGTGLGLSTVYGIVRQCGASIGVDSQPGKGTRFDIVFPAVTRLDPASARPPRAVAREPIAGDRVRPLEVLLVEDNPALAEATAAYLQDYGIRVRVAPDGEAGLELFRRHQADIDLVISDVVMPRLSGVELAHAILAEKASVRLILWSGYPSATGTAELRDPASPSASPARFRFIRKPLPPDELLATIQELMDAQTP